MRMTELFLFADCGSCGKGYRLRYRGAQLCTAGERHIVQVRGLSFLC
jgi:hypothetical protein